MAWYRVGTATVTNGSASVTGVGTAFITVGRIRAGDAFKGPDGETYEVLSVASDTSLTLASNYAGSSTTGAYAIFPTQGEVRDLTEQVRNLIGDYTVPDLDAAATPISGDDLLLVYQSGVAKRTAVQEIGDSIHSIDGADPTGIVDSTTAIQDEIAASYGGDLHIPGGIYMVSALTVSQSLRILGPGTLKQIASTSADMITVSGTSTKLTLDGITLDGNQANQAADNYATIKHTAVGTSSDPALLEVVNCTLKNGRWADITVLGDAQRSTLDKVVIRGCKFFGGKEGTTTAYGPRYVDIRACADYIVSDNVFDFCGTPAAFGRAGVLAYDGYDTTFYPSRGVVSGNHFNNVGRSQATTTLGCIDLYDTGRSTAITGNMIMSPYGRGIQCKADCESLSITGNTIDGLLGGSDGTMNAQIVVNGATRDVSEGAVAIVGNTCLDSGRDGISITADSFSGSTHGKGYLITGNTVRNATRRGIGAAQVDDITITGNTVLGCDINIYVQTALGAVNVNANLISGSVSSGLFIADDCDSATISITNNIIEDSGSRGIYVAAAARGRIAHNTVLDSTSSGIEVLGTSGPFLVQHNSGNDATPFTNGGSNAKLWVSDNAWENQMSFTARLLTISGGAITPWTEFHWVDTEGAAATDNLDDIGDAVVDGQMLTIRAADVSHTVVAKDGSVMRLAGDCTLDNSQDTLTLRWLGDTWIEIARSDNGA